MAPLETTPNRPPGRTSAPGHNPCSVPFQLPMTTTCLTLPWRLAPRHARVANLLLQGLCDKDIAKETGLTLQAVRTYVKCIYKAVGVHSRVELLFRMVQRQGWPTPGEPGAWRPPTLD